MLTVKKWGKYIESGEIIIRWFFKLSDFRLDVKQ